MKFIRKNAEFVGYTELRGERSNEWRCPNCGFGVSEDYTHCPYCGQKIKFNEVLEMKMTRWCKPFKKNCWHGAKKGAIEMEIMFSTEKHKEFFISMITKVNTWDRYHMALFYTLGISPDCRKHIEDLFTFSGENYGIKPETALLCDWQTDGSRACTRLGYNLFNGLTDRKTDPGSLFACKYAPYFLEAIKLCYPNLFKKKIYCVKDAEGNVVKESIDSLGLAKIYVGTYENKYQKNYTAEPQEPVHTDIDI